MWGRAGVGGASVGGVFVGGASVGKMTLGLTSGKLPGNPEPLGGLSNKNVGDLEKSFLALPREKETARSKLINA